MRTLFLSLFIIIQQVSFSQNIGIGTTNPTKGKLEIVGVAGSGNTTAIFGSNANGISFQQNWPTIGFNQYRDNTAGNGKFMNTGYAAIQYMDPTGGGMYIDMLGTGAANTLTTSGTRAIAITKDGDVGIRNNGGGASLTVGRGTAVNTAIFIGTTYASYINNSTEENTFIRGGKANSRVYINDIPGAEIIMGSSDCMVSLNAGLPDYTFEMAQVNDKGLAILSPQGNAWEIFNGNLPLFFKYNTTAVSYIDWDDGRYAQLSDSRLKKNIETMSPVLDKLLQLQPVEYDMRNAVPGKKKRIGFIAQEVYKLFPNIVSILPDSLNYGHPGINNLHMMDYSSFGVLCVKAIQEQQSIIEKQQAQLDELKKRLDKLERKL